MAFSLLWHVLRGGGGFCNIEGGQICSASGLDIYVADPLKAIRPILTPSYKDLGSEAGHHFSISSFYNLFEESLSHSCEYP